MNKIKDYRKGCFNCNSSSEIFYNVHIVRDNNTNYNNIESFRFGLCNHCKYMKYTEKAHMLWRSDKSIKSIHFSTKNNFERRIDIKNGCVVCDTGLGRK